MQTKIAVVVFHQEGDITIKGFIKNEALPDTFGLIGAAPVHLSKVPSITKAFKTLLQKTFEEGPGILSQVHPVAQKPQQDVSSEKLSQ